MKIVKPKWYIRFLLLITISLCSVNIYAQPLSNNCLIMQMATQGSLQKNGVAYQLTLEHSNSWLIDFKHIHKNQSASFRHDINQNNLYQYMQQSFSTHKNQPLAAEIISFDTKHKPAHFEVLINKISFNQRTDRFIYQMNLLNQNPIVASKLVLKHIVLLIEGDDVCINCGDPW